MSHASRIALCDCNNFFVSCERLLRPELRRRPVVVLSSNDGCIISRSDEVKRMGIPMAEPYFRVKKLLEQKGVAVFSGNHDLYRALSRRVMGILTAFTDAIEVYSIDEAFLNLSMASVADPLAYAAQIRYIVGRWAGIPMSVGIAASKTLAKLAAEKAKGEASGIYEISGANVGRILDDTAVESIWGIGFRSARMLKQWNIRTAGDFIRKEPNWVKKKMAVRGLMTQMELSGCACMPIEDTAQPPRSIQVTRTFGQPLHCLDDLEKPVVEHTISAGRRLRAAGMAAKTIAVFIRYGYKSGEHGYLSNESAFEFPVTSDRELIREALALLRVIYRSERYYTKAGVTLGTLCPASFRQGLLFSEQEENREIRAKYERLSTTVDQINAELGARTIYPAALAVKEKKWQPRQEMKSGQKVVAGQYILL